MGWAALDNKHQVYENQPKKAFQKAKSIYGKRMQHAPMNPPLKSTITTNFDELLRLRKENAAQNFRISKITNLTTSLGISLFIIVLLYSILYL